MSAKRSDDIDTNWVMRHPSAAITILVFVGLGVSWAAGQWHRDQVAPQWSKVHESIDQLHERDVMIVEYSLEHGRHVRSALRAIAVSGGVVLPQPEEELTRSIARMRDIKDGAE